MSAKVKRMLQWSMALVVAAMAMRVMAQGPAQTPPAQPPASAQAAPQPNPVQIANNKERQRIMDELKISAIPPGAISSSPATYDEATANPYPDLPDPLTLKNGQKVTTAAVWKNRRRAELLEDFQREIYGRTPKVTPKVAWSVVGTESGKAGDVATTTRQLLGRVDNSAYPAITVNIQATLTTPAEARGPVPVIIIFGGGAFPLPAGVPAASNPCAPPGGFGARGAGAGRAGSWRRRPWSVRAGRTVMAGTGAGEGMGLREPQHRQRPGGTAAPD